MSNCPHITWEEKDPLRDGLHRACVLGVCLHIASSNSYNKLGEDCSVLHDLHEQMEAGGWGCVWNAIVKATQLLCDRSKT